MVYDCGRVFFARRVGQQLECASSRIQGRVSNRAIYRGMGISGIAISALRQAQKHLMHYVFDNAYEQSCRTFSALFLRQQPAQIV